MAELETKEPGGDGRAGAASARFQTALSFPTLSAGFKQGREVGHMQAGCTVHHGQGSEDQQPVKCTKGGAERTSSLCSAPSAGQRGPVGRCVADSSHHQGTHRRPCSTLICTKDLIGQHWFGSKGQRYAWEPVAWLWVPDTLSCLYPWPSSQSQ